MSKLSVYLHIQLFPQPSCQPPIANGSTVNLFDMGFLIIIKGIHPFFHAFGPLKRFPDPLYWTSCTHRVWRGTNSTAPGWQSCKFYVKTEPRHATLSMTPIKFWNASNRIATIMNLGCKSLADINRQWLDDTDKWRILPLGSQIRAPAAPSGSLIACSLNWNWRLGEWTPYFVIW